ncbi:MAG: DUF2007 domain-containing protein [Bacteroidia bacterium]|jgi:hypothetical protein|nr:DUF2007 domain-containing protein [Bacteroidia bacterium]
MSEDLVRVYTGSIVEATYLKEMLLENGIGCILRDTLNESLMAGWGSGSPENSVVLLVETSLSEEAEKLIGQYFDFT